MRHSLGRANRYLPAPFSGWAAPILAAGAIGLFAACAAQSGHVQGQVFEVVNSEAPPSQWTRVSSADAYVVVHWLGSVAGPHAATACLHATLGKTDERGRFNLSGQWTAPRAFLVFQDDPAVMVYKPGFDPEPVYDDPTPVVRTLVRSKLPAERRIPVLSAIADTGCQDHQTSKTVPFADPQGVAARFYRALYEEALALGPIPHELDHDLANLREKAGVPQPPAPPWLVEPIRPQGPRPAAPRER
jgi:hypothetical protein